MIDTILGYVVENYGTMLIGGACTLVAGWLGLKAVVTWTPNTFLEKVCYDIGDWHSKLMVRRFGNMWNIRFEKTYIGALYFMGNAYVRGLKKDNTIITP